MNCVDLHTHSTFSDGTLTPTELVELAVQKGLQALSVTDHDTMDGVGEAVDAGKRLGLEVIPGIEMSVMHYEAAMHMLGYWQDPANRQLERALAGIHLAREKRNEQIVIKLQAQGIPITMSEVKRIAGKGQTGRPHVGRVLVELGVVSSVYQAFEQYLKKGGSGYVARQPFSAFEAIALIKEAGGIAVLAHPLHAGGTLDHTLQHLLPELIKAGLDGIEVYYPTHSVKVRNKLIANVEKYNLVMTGGSDYHGAMKPGTSLAGGKNVYVPSEVITAMKERRDR